MEIVPGGNMIFEFPSNTAIKIFAILGNCLCYASCRLFTRLAASMSRSYDRGELVLIVLECSVLTAPASPHRLLPRWTSFSGRLTISPRWP